MNKFLAVLLIAAVALTGQMSFARSSFGGSRSSSSSSSGRSSSFGGSRSGSSSSSGSSKSSSTFGGSRSSSGALIVRRNPPSSSGSSGYHSSTTYVNHNYYGGYYGSPYYGGGFIHGFFWGQFFNRPTVVYVGGNSYVAGPNGQPMLDEGGQPVQYQSNPAMTALAVLLWLVIIALLVYAGMYIYGRVNE